MAIKVKNSYSYSRQERMHLHAIWHLVCKKPSSVLFRRSEMIILYFNQIIMTHYTYERIIYSVINYCLSLSPYRGMTATFIRLGQRQRPMSKAARSGQFNTRL